MAEEEKRANLSGQRNFRTDAEDRRAASARDAMVKEATVAEEGRTLMRANHDRIVREEKRRRLALLAECSGLISEDPSMVYRVTGQVGKNLPLT